MKPPTSSIETRRQEKRLIVDTLRERGAGTIAELAEWTGMDYARVGTHLRQLMAAEIVTSRYGRSTAARLCTYELWETVVARLKTHAQPRHVTPHQDTSTRGERVA